jgi:hypothetical protein
VIEGLGIQIAIIRSLQAGGLAGSDGLVEGIEEALYLLDGIFTLLAGLLPVSLRGKGIETEQRLEEEFAEAKIIFCREL